MQNLAMLFALCVLFCAYCARGIFMKFAQRGRVNTLRQALVHIALYSALQAAALLAAPPYPTLICEASFFIYPLGFAVFYTVGYMMLVMAMAEGSTSITNTINSFNCLIPVFFGIIAWNEALSIWKGIGLALFAIGLVLYNRSSYSVGGVRRRISAKWLVHTLLSLVLMGIAVIFTKSSMRAYPQYGEQYLIYYALFSLAISVPIILCCARKEARLLLGDVKFIAHTGAAAVAFDITNYFFVSYINRFPGAFFLPLCSVVGMLSVMVGGRVFLKEKISRSAIISSIICVIAIVFLNF